MEFPCGSAVMNPAGIHEDAGLIPGLDQRVKDPLLPRVVRSLALLSGLGIGLCHELWCRLQMQLRSSVAVAVV